MNTKIHIISIVFKINDITQFKMHKNTTMYKIIPFHNLVRKVLIENIDLVLTFCAATAVIHVCGMF